MTRLSEHLQEGLGVSSPSAPTALAPPSGVEPASGLEQSRSSHDAERWTQDDIDFEMFRDAEEDDDFFDCHMGPDGLCGAAGSEWCEFECPTMREFRRR